MNKKKDHSIGIVIVSVLFWGVLGYYGKGVSGALELGSLAFAITAFVYILQASAESL